MAILDERLDHRDLLRDVLDGAWLDVGREEAEFFAIGVEFLGPGGGEGGESLAGCLRIPDRFIVHIGDISDVVGAGAASFEGAAENILKDEGAEIPNVGGAVNGGTAAVEAEGGAVDGGEVSLSSGKRVKKPHGGI